MLEFDHHYQSSRQRVKNNQPAMRRKGQVPFNELFQTEEWKPQIEFMPCETFSLDPTWVSNESFCEFVGTCQPCSQPTCCMAQEFSHEERVSSAMKAEPYEGKSTVTLIFDTGASQTVTPNKGYLYS